jgi:hypothetical protein
MLSTIITIGTLVITIASAAAKLIPLVIELF